MSVILPPIHRKDVATVFGAGSRTLASGPLGGGRFADSRGRHGHCVSSALENPLLGTGFPIGVFVGMPLAVRYGWLLRRGTGLGD